MPLPAVQFSGLARITMLRVALAAASLVGTARGQQAPTLYCADPKASNYAAAQVALDTGEGGPLSAPW